LSRRKKARNDESFSLTIWRAAVDAKGDSQGGKRGGNRKKIGRPKNKKGPYTRLSKEGVLRIPFSQKKRGKKGEKNFEDRRRVRAASCLRSFYGDSVQEDSIGEERMGRGGKITISRIKPHQANHGGGGVNAQSRGRSEPRFRLVLIGEDV